MRNVSVVSNGSLGGGNTILPPRAPLAKKWIFTLNNWSDFELKSIISSIVSVVSSFYVIGEEIGEQGTPHLQGYVEMGKKIRPTEFFKNKRIHFEKVRGSREQNMVYCKKEGKFHTNIPEPLKLYDEWESECTPYKYQLKIKEIINGPVASRTIYWFWEPEGNTGKSVFTKHLCLKHDALVLSGKGNDCKAAIAYNPTNGIIKKPAPKLIIFDYPRSSMGYINYAVIEEIKNGCFFSGKYESQMFLMNKPHIIIFANEEPDYDKLSKDRWCVEKIEIDQTINKFYE